MNGWMAAFDARWTWLSNLVVLSAWLASAARCSEALRGHPVRWAGLVQSQLLCGLW